MSSPFANIPAPPPDGIFGVATKFNASQLKKKFLLSAGVYKTNEGKPYVFPSVMEAETRILHKNSKDYLPLTGHPRFLQLASELLWKDLLPTIGHRIGSLQTCAGTGGLFLVGRFAKQNLNVPSVLLSNPAYANYASIFSKTGNAIGYYRWTKDFRFDLDGLLEDIKAAPHGSLAVFQPCAHNPSGVDPSHDEWLKIFDAIDQNNILLLLDFAYMGFASGDPDEDCWVTREYAKRGKCFFVVFSFSKCMGLYGERLGCLHCVCANEDEAKRVRGHMEIHQRSSYSNCPQNGALIAAEVLGDPQLRAKWDSELRAVASRLIAIRKEFVNLLEAKAKKDWSFMRKQRGMFGLTGLTPEEVEILGQREGVFILTSSRISISALNTENIDAIAQAFANVVNQR